MICPIEKKLGLLSDISVPIKLPIAVQKGNDVLPFRIVFTFSVLSAV